MASSPMGRRIKKAMRAAGLTQAALARACGYQAPAVTQWLNGTTTPSTESLYKIAKACGVDVADLMPASLDAEARG